MVAARYWQSGNKAIERTERGQEEHRVQWRKGKIAFKKGGYNVKRKEQRDIKTGSATQEHVREYFSD